MTPDSSHWDSLVDSAPPEIREALDRLRHHVVLTTPHAGTAVAAPQQSRQVHTVAREAMGSVLAWAARPRYPSAEDLGTWTEGP